MKVKRFTSLFYKSENVERIPHALNEKLLSFVLSFRNINVCDTTKYENDFM